jgi:hypothetical protein
MLYSFLMRSGLTQETGNANSDPVALCINFIKAGMNLNPE